MSIIERLFGKNDSYTVTPSAEIARERLQIILAHERSGGGEFNPDYLPALQSELITVISKYVTIAREDIKVQLERQGNIEVLEVNIILPDR